MSLQLGLDLAVEETTITDPGVKAAVELQLGLDVGWSGSPRSRLQLGLDLAVEETTSRGAESVMSTIASIGPRPRGRGNPPAHPLGVPGPAPASIGPRPRGRGNQARQGEPVRLRPASIGPRPRGRGNKLLVRKVTVGCEASIGPRPRGRGNFPLLEPDGAGEAASIGPRPRGRGNPEPNEHEAGVAAELQLGLDLAVEETPGDGFGDRPRLRRASIGPRPRGRGNHELPARNAGFRNASIGPRPRGRGNLVRLAKDADVVDKLQLGLDLAVEETRPHSWKPSRVVMLQLGPDLAVEETGCGFGSSSLQPAGFNWASTSRSRKRSSVAGGGDSRVAASIGPRPRGRGNCHRCSAPRPRPARLQLGLDLAVEETVARGIVVLDPVVASIGPRPRGRGNRALARQLDVAVLASIGPRPRGRGNDVQGVRSPSWTGRFNWASTSRSRKPRGRRRSASRRTRCFNWASTSRSRKRTHRPPWAQLMDEASIGPRPRGRGNAVLRLRFCGGQSLLQLGLDLAVEETRSVRRGGQRLCVASIGPRPRGRGNRPLHRG